MNTASTPGFVRSAPALQQSPTAEQILQIDATFDSAARPIAISLDDGTDIKTQSYTYDECNRILTYKSPLGGTITYFYYNTGAVHTASSLAGIETRYYSPDGNITKLATGPNVHTYGYDRSGRRVSHHLNGEASRTLVYDLRDRLTNIVDSTWGLITLSYGPSDRLIRIEYQE